MVNERDVHALLSGLGIKSSDTVMIHTSMRAIGDAALLRLQPAEEEAFTVEYRSVK